MPGGTQLTDVHPGNVLAISLQSEPARISCPFRRIWLYLSPAAPVSPCQLNDPFTCGCMRMGTAVTGDIVMQFYGIPITITVAPLGVRAFSGLAGQMVAPTRDHSHSPGPLQR